MNGRVALWGWSGLAAIVSGLFVFVLTGGLHDPHGIGTLFAMPPLVGLMLACWGVALHRYGVIKQRPREQREGKQLLMAGGGMLLVLLAIALYVWGLSLWA